MHEARMRLQGVDREVGEHGGDAEAGGLGRGADAYG